MQKKCFENIAGISSNFRGISYLVLNLLVKSICHGQCSFVKCKVPHFPTFTDDDILEL